MLLDKKELVFILKILDKKTKLKYILFFFLVIIVAIFEYITIIESVGFARKLLGANVDNQINSLKGLDHSIIFLILIVLTNLGRALVTQNGIRLAYISASQVCQKAYNNFLEQGYLDYLNTNSSELISIVTEKTKILSTDLLLPLIRIASSALMMLFIGFSILEKAPLYTIFSTLVIFISYLIMSMITSNSMKINSRNISLNSAEIVKIVQESVSSFREIKLSGFEQNFFKLFSTSEHKLRISDSNTRILSEIPRYIIESLIFSVIIILSLIFISYQNGSNNPIIISSLGAFLYGSQRLLPLAQNTYRSLSTIRSSTFSVKDILKYIKNKKPQKIIHQENINFSQNIIINSIEFSYPKSNKKVLKNCNLEINKGDLVCILGNSGSGKSTLMDIVMGLIKPTKGSLYIDGIELEGKNIKSWQEKLAHVPQEILLIDNTIRRNIAFGIPDNEIDDEKLDYAIKVSCLDKLIKNLKFGKNTQVGERGSLLSGGQKQRIGIARAIYQAKEVLFLDEATSALDKTTEGRIIRSLTRIKNKLTIIMITHRPRDEIKYDKIIELKRIQT